MISPQRRSEILSALRDGVVPRSSLGLFAVGLDRFEPTLVEELSNVRSGAGRFKAVRGDYGTGKTFFSRWLADRARQQGFATSEVQISETETPLHRLETVYRRLIERLGTSDTPAGALRSILDSWFYTLEQDVLAENPDADPVHVSQKAELLMETRLASVSTTAPLFAMALRAYHQAQVKGDKALAQGIAAWLSGEPNISASIKRQAGLRGEIDHFGALGFLQGLLTVLRDSGRSGLFLVLDEVETLQRVRSDIREKSLNALRQWIDELDGGRFPGLYLLITGTPSFFDGAQGVQRLPPLAQRLQTDFSTDARFDNPRAIQIRLTDFTLDRLVEVGRKVRDIYAEGGSPRVLQLADDAYIKTLAQSVAGKLGGKFGIAPRIFLKKLVSGVLDPIDVHADFDPRLHYQLTIEAKDLSTAEKHAAGYSVPASLDDIELDGISPGPSSAHGKPHV